MDRTVAAMAVVGQSGIPWQASPAGNTDAAARDLAVVHLDPVSASESEVQGQLARGLATGQVVVGTIPQQPPGFLPKPALLALLNRAGPGAPMVHVLTGMRGAGKTQLAAAYARAKLEAGWRLVAWINAADTRSLLADLAAVADAAGFSDGDFGWDAADLGRTVRRRLEADGARCLLVFDDVEDPDVVRPFVPAYGAAGVLITSTRQSATDLGITVPVDVFSEEEALAFLAERTGLGEGGATAVAGELGYLPLALSQAGAVMAGRRMGYYAYLERLRALPAENHLTREKEQQPYPHGVAEAVLLSMEALRADDPAGVCAGIMEIMAVLSAAGVRRELLHAAGQAGFLARRRLRSRVSAALVDRALVQLAERLLLTFSLDGQTIIAHSLVMRVVREGLARRGRLAAACWAAATVLDTRAAALAGSRDRVAIRDIPEQATALLQNAAGPGAGADDELTRILLSLQFWVLYHLNELGDSASQAIAVGEPLVSDFDRVLGPDHPETLGSRNSLAAAYLAAGRGAEAISLFEQILAARERLLGLEHPETLGSRNSLAAAYQAAGRGAEAISLFEQILATRERLLGADHPDTLTTQNNLAAAYWDAGRGHEAIFLFEQTLAARERLLGADDPRTLNSRGNLAAAYRAAGRVAEAIPLFEQTLAGQERLLSPDHPDIQRLRSDLADAYRAAGWVAEAIPLVEQILAVRERLLGVDHPRTLASRNNLAAAYRSVGRAAEAIPLHEQTLAACERLLGVDHPRTLASRNNLAAAYRDVGRAAEAIPLFEQTLAARERVLGAEHPDTLATRNSLAAINGEAGQTE